MNRREALQRTAVVLGGAIIGADVFLSGCTTSRESHYSFQTEDLVLLNEIAEIILPATSDSPGAKAANVAAFMQTIVTDCYTSSDKETFFNGLTSLREEATRVFKNDFISLSATEKQSLLEKIDKKAADEDEHYFSMLKQLTLWGYFSSEIGVTQALRYEPIPGRYDGCVPYKAGEKAWA